jgi:hypothetical protein
MLDLRQKDFQNDSRTPNRWNGVRVFAEALLSAVLNIRHRDDVVRLSPDDDHGARGSHGETTTAMAEVMRTIGWLRRAGTACLRRLVELLAENPGPATSVMAANAIEAIRTDALASTTTGAATIDACCCEAPTDAAPASPESDASGLLFQDHSRTELRLFLTWRELQRVGRGEPASNRGIRPR